MVAVADSFGGEVPDIGATAGLGDGQRADQVALQGGSHVGVDQPLVARGDHVRHRDPAGEQGGEHAAGGAGLVHLLADDDGVGAVATPTTHRFGHAGAEQSRGAGLEVQIARQLTVAFPRRGVGQDFAFGEGAHRLSELVAFWGVPDVGHSSLSGMSRQRDRNHSPRPLACGSNRA